MHRKTQNKNPETCPSVVTTCACNQTYSRPAADGKRVGVIFVKHLQVPDIYDSAKYDSIHNRHLGLDFRDLYQVRRPLNPTTDEWLDICCAMRRCIATLLRLHQSCVPHAASNKHRCAFMTRGRGHVLKYKTAHRH